MNDPLLTPAIRHPLRWLLLIVIGALLLRLLLLPLIHHPGVGDPNHYYNLGLRLLNGQGFTIDYIWQYNAPYTSLVHPDDYWTPLTALLAAGSMALFGQTVSGALIVFVVLGSLIPLVAYAAVRQFGLPVLESLYAAALAAVLPELVLNSLRTDTTIPNVLLVGACLLLLVRAVQRSEGRWYLLAGVCAGLAYLVRSDSVLVIGVAGLVVGLHWLLGRIQPRRRVLWALLLPLAALVVMLPWLIRNLNEIGSLSTPTTGNMFFLTDYRDHYFYDTVPTLQTMLQQQTVPQLIGKRLFELAASLRLMIVTLDMGLPIAMVGGVLLLLRRRQRDEWLRLAPVLLMLAAILVFYPLLVPYKSQGGSFKKAYITLIPLLLPIGMLALRQAIADARLRTGAVVITVLLMSMNAFELVRVQARLADDFLSTVQKAADVIATLPDTNGDGQIILMTQDPFILRFVGYSSVMYPFEDRATILNVADRFGVDYLLLPAARPALDDLYLGSATDPRLLLAARVPGTSMQLLAVVR